MERQAKGGAPWNALGRITEHGLGRVLFNRYEPCVPVSYMGLFSMRMGCSAQEVTQAFVSLDWSGI